MHSGAHVPACAVYMAPALNLEGDMELLELWVGEAEGTMLWPGVLTELKNRGLEDVSTMLPSGPRVFPRPLPPSIQTFRSSSASCTWSGTRCAT